MAIKGNLRDMSLPTLVQMTCQEGNQARLTIQHDDKEAILYFADGNIVHAVLDDQAGEEVVYHALTWEDGEFDLESGKTSPAHTIETPWSALLVDGLHRRDEEHWETLDIEQIKEGYDMPENMRDILKELGDQLSGFVAASVVGMDGLGIAEHSTGRVDVEAINAQMTLLIKLVDTSVTRLGAGTIEDYLLTTENAYLLIRFLSGDEYYLGIAADRREASLGNIRLQSRIYADRLSKAMPR